MQADDVFSLVGTWKVCQIRTVAITAVTVVLSAASTAIGTGEVCTEPFTPRQDSLPVPPESGAIVLFDGQGINLFVSMSGDKSDWPIEDSALISTPNSRRSNNIVSRLLFRDADIHIEYMLPPTGDGNSGIYVHGFYELQILDSFGKKQPESTDMGGLYGLFKPRVNAARRPTQWQVIDIRFRAPRRDAGDKLISQGMITAWLNGQKIHNCVNIGQEESQYNPYRYDTSSYLKGIRQIQQQKMTGPLILQDHDNPVRFRNVWVKPLDDCAFLYSPSSGKRHADSESPVVD